MNNMYGKDKFHDRQKAVLQKSAQKIENDSGWAQNNFMREYAEEILPASGAELSFGELCAIGEHVEQEAAFSAKEAMRNKIKERRDAERYKSTGMDSEQRTPNPFEDSSAIATESPKNEDTLNTTRKHADAKPTKSAGIKTSKKQSLVETTRELKKYIHIISCGGVLYYHNEYYYTQLDSKQLIKLYRQNVDYELNNESSLRGYKDLYDCLVTDPQIECSEPEDEPIYAPLENGILDLMEWKLYPHSPDQITFTCIKAKYDPQAKCQVFEEYLQRVTGGDSLLSERVWMAIGYLLIYPARGKFFIFMKGIGNSGKSVLGSFIRRLYPKESMDFSNEKNAVYSFLFIGPEDKKQEFMACVERFCLGEEAQQETKKETEQDYLHNAQNYQQAGNAEMAFQQYMVAARDYGHPKAQFEVARCYQNGTGVEKNEENAVVWYRKSAEQGYAMAQCDLGYCYYCGEGVKKDFGKAAEWYRKSAEQGNATAQRNLAIFYKNGYGVTQNKEEAVKWNQKAAEQGNTEAQNSLGCCYKWGEGVEKDLGKAIEWYRKSAENGNELAQYNLGLCYEYGDGVTKDLGRAAEWYRKSAEQGNADAQCELGHCYYYGRGVTENKAEAAKWYRKAAKQGNADAQYNLCCCYENGEGVEKNSAKAVEWCRKSAENGNASAQYKLGLFYENGYGVAQNKEEAVKWYRKSAEQGYADAQYNLAKLLVWKDGEEAFKWYQKAAKQGHAGAQNGLGFCYEEPDKEMEMMEIDIYPSVGVEKDSAKAVEWYRKAAEQGYAMAQCNLGNCYRQGRGVEKNLEKAVEWYRKSAEQGYDLGQFCLAGCYEKGEGVPIDKEKALQWYKKAADQGFMSAKLAINNMQSSGIGTALSVLEFGAAMATVGVLEKLERLGKIFKG